MNKKILTTAIALSAALTLSACSNTPNTTTETNDAKTNNAAVETSDNTTNTANTTNKKDDAATTNTATANDANTEASPTAGELAKATVTNDEAFDKFLELHPGAKIDSFSLGLDDGVLKYSIDGYDDTNEYEVNINAVDGAVISDEVDTDNDKNTGDIQKADLAKVTTFLEQALADAGSDYITKGYGFDYDNGKLIVEVEVHNGSKDIDYDYDFETGKLIEKDM